MDEAGLHLAGRAKWVIKPKGYQVFPAQVEDALAGLADAVAMVGVVGVEHEVFGEAIVAFVERKPDAEVTAEGLEAHARDVLAAYMRPLHYEILEPGTFPLNRVAKTDSVLLAERAREIVARLREQGGWDRA